MRLRAVSLAVAVVLLVAPMVLVGSATVRGAPPQPPMSLYGDVSVNGNDAASGYTIVAINESGTEVGSIEVENGSYGGAGAFEEKLDVECACETNGTIRFRIGDMQANETVPFEFGEVKRLDLTFTENASRPVANNDSYDAAVNVTLSVAAPGVLSNDDPGGHSLSVERAPVAGPTAGTVRLAANGSFRYTPDPGFTGEDSFVYEVRNGSGGTDTATVTVSVPPVCPEAAVSGSDDTISLAEIQAAIDWWADDTAIPGTDGRTIGLSELQELIDAWATNTPVSCS
jgi:hypothetical protein